MAEPGNSRSLTGEFRSPFMSVSQWTLRALNSGVCSSHCRPRGDRDDASSSQRKHPGTLVIYGRAQPMRRIDRRREQPWRGNGGVFHIHDFVLNQQHQFQRDRANSSRSATHSCSCSCRYFAILNAAVMIGGIVTRRLEGASLVDTDDTNSMGSDIATIQKTCSVGRRLELLERRVRCAIPICSPLPPR